MSTLRVIARTYGFSPQDIESQIRAVSQDIPNVRVNVLENIYVVLVFLPNVITFEEFKQRLSSCSAIKSNTICEDCETEAIE